MESVNWIGLIVFFTFGIAFILLIKRFIINKSVTHLYFSLAALTVSASYLGTIFFNTNNYNIIEWGKLISITTYISGLLAFVRESKPIFARFPIYLTALPLISILFFPLIIETIVIRDVINAIYQGGALVVTIMVFTLNNAKESGRRYYIIGLSLISAAYLGYWIYFNRSDIENYSWIPQIVLSAGILITIFRFVRSKQHN